MMQLSFPGVNGNGEIYLDVMRAICGNTNDKSMIDLGCNLAPYTCQLGFEKRTYIDILPRELDNKEEQQYFIQANVLEFLKNSDQHYNTAIASDFIEHLTELDGMKLLILMENYSDKQVLFTPLGNYMVDKEGSNPEGHHSGWLPENVPDYACLIFENYHPTLGIGAFFFFKCKNLREEFDRVVNELKQKSWAK